MADRILDRALELRSATEAGMRALVQRVTRAGVYGGRREVSAIGPGMLVLLGVRKGDGEPEVEKMAAKLLKLRIFEDAEGRMNESRRRPRDSLRQPVHPLRRHPQGQPARLDRGGRR